MGQQTKYDDPDDPEFYERQQRFDEAEYELLALMRQALSIPEGDLSLPVPGVFLGRSCDRKCGNTRAGRAPADGMIMTVIFPPGAAGAEGIATLHTIPVPW